MYNSYNLQATHVFVILHWIRNFVIFGLTQNILCSFVNSNFHWVLIKSGCVSIRLWRQVRELLSVSRTVILAPRPPGPSAQVQRPSCSPLSRTRSVVTDMLLELFYVLCGVMMYTFVTVTVNCCSPCILHVVH